MTTMSEAMGGAKRATRTISLGEMHRLVTCNHAGWVWKDRDHRIGHIATSEGWWNWSDEMDCYILVKSATE
jgi:hypothetical protein